MKSKGFQEAAANAGLANQAVMGCDWAISNFLGNTEMELYFRITKALVCSFFSFVEVFSPRCI